MCMHITLYALLEVHDYVDMHVCALHGAVHKPVFTRAQRVMCLFRLMCIHVSVVKNAPSVS